MSTNGEIWILGANGRCGRGVAAQLSAKGARLVLVGRERARLEQMAQSRGGARVIVSPSIEQTSLLLEKESPTVVVNTVGPFSRTGRLIARACKTSHYVDLSNDLFAVVDLLADHGRAVKEGRCLVPGAGWGFLGTESVVRKLCQGAPPAGKVRVDMFAAIDEAGPVGEALAASIIDGLVRGSCRYRGGALVPATFGADSEKVVLPDGSAVVSSLAPLGDLLAAQRASGAPDAVAGSPLAPSSAVVGKLVGAAGVILRWGALRGLAERRLARLEPPPPKEKKAHSFARARVEWSDGKVKTGWLRAGEAMLYTCTALAEVAWRLSEGEGRPGAFTPGELFGPELAEACGGTFLIDES